MDWTAAFVARVSASLAACEMADDATPGAERRAMAVTAEDPSAVDVLVSEVARAFPRVSVERVAPCHAILSFFVASGSRL